jgi:hypothetical protein
MGDPLIGMTINRKNNDGYYEPKNCHWASSEEQSNNKRTNVFLEFKGKRLTIAQWSREIGIPRKRLEQRIRNGWSLKRALST